MARVEEGARRGEGARGGEGAAAGQIAGGAGGPFSTLARGQYAALASMRWSMFRNSLRTTRGAIEAGARTIAFAFYMLVGLGLAAGFGGGAYAIAASGKWQMLQALFWGLFVLWQVVPLTLASFQEQFDMGGLLRFPVSFGTFFLLHLIFGLADASTMVGGLCCAGIWIGITLARADVYASSALALAMFAAFNILLVRAIAAWIDRWLAQRRTREIVSTLFFVGLLGLQLLNPAYWSSEKYEHVSARTRSEGLRWLSRVNAVQHWLPPGLAALDVERSVARRRAAGLQAVSLLGLYVVGIGGVLGVRLRGEYRGENFGDAPAARRVERGTRSWLLDGSGPMAAVMEKEARLMARAVPMMYALGAPLVMVFLLSGLFNDRGAGHGPPSSMTMLIGLGYALVGFTQLFYNNLGTEGPGIQMLLLCPIPMRTILLGKNLFHALLFAVDAVLVCILVGLRAGWPAPAAVAATVAWVLFALPVNLAAGNLFSLNMPFRMNLGRISRQKGSQASSLFSLLVQLGVFGVGAGVLAACSYIGRLWVAVPVLAVLAVAALIAWMRVMDRVDVIAARRRESLMAALARAD